MWGAIRGWVLRVYPRVRSPYEIDRGPFGEKGWQERRPAMALGDVSMSFRDLNQGRTVLGELPSTQVFEGTVPSYSGRSPGLERAAAEIFHASQEGL